MYLCAVCLMIIASIMSIKISQKALKQAVGHYAFVQGGAWDVIAAVKGV